MSTQNFVRVSAYQYKRFLLSVYSDQVMYNKESNNNAFLDIHNFNSLEPPKVVLPFIVLPSSYNSRAVSRGTRRQG